MSRSVVGLLVCAAFGALSVSSVMAAEGPPPAAAPQAPAPPEQCQSPCRLELRLIGELPTALAGREGVARGALVDGVRASYQGDKPLDVRLVAARYQDNRLVRYGVSQRLTLQPGASDAIVADAGMVFEAAFRPMTERDVRIHALDAGAGATPALAVAGFVGSIPPTLLVAGGLPGVLPEERAGEAYRGALGLLLLLPDNPEVRKLDTLTVQGLVLRLQPIAVTAR